MIECVKFDGCLVRDKGLQQVGEGGFMQVVLVGWDVDGVKNGDDFDNYYQFNQGKILLFIYKLFFVVIEVL